MSEKTIKALRIAGAAAAVYVVFRYMLPLVAPFVFALAAASALKPSACGIAKRLRISWRGRQFGVPPCVIGVLELAGIMAVLAAAVYTGGRRLWNEAVLLADQAPFWLESLDHWLTEACRRTEEALELREGSMIRLAQEMILGLGDRLKQGIMPYLMGNSVAATRYAAEAVVITVLFVMGVMLFIQELDTIRERMEKSVFHEEYERLGMVLKGVGKAYLKTQGAILLLTMGICTAGMLLLKSPYAILAGMGLGLLDALPVFGTGTVLVPWALFCFFRRRWGRGLTILSIYLACYLIREFLEAKMLGDRVGLSPLETLVSIYAGLKLFGLAGVILGPLGVLTVREFAK